MVKCSNCNIENPDSNLNCSECQYEFVIAILECTEGEDAVQTGKTWKLNAKDYIIGRSATTDICIPGNYVSRQHGKLIYNSEEKKFYYQSLARNTMEYEKKSYKILDGAILPFPENIELKINYCQS